MNPLYKYISTDSNSCEYCSDNGFEIIQSIKDEPMNKCPKCNCKVTKVFGRQAKNYATERRMNYSHTNQDYKRMGLKKYKKTSRGYQREA